MNKIAYSMIITLSVQICEITENIQGVNRDISTITPPFLINKVYGDKKIGVDT